VNVSEVKERNLPELDDEFARGHGDGYESLDALRSEVELELKTEAQQAQDSEYRQSVVDELLGIVTMEIPPLLVDHEVEHMVQSRDAYIERLKIARDDYFRITGKTEEEVLVEFRENAASRLSRTYSLAKVAEVEGLEVSSGEVDAKIKEMFGEEGLRGESTEQGDERLEAVTDSVRESILMDKSLDRLAEIAKGEAADSVSAEQPQESPQKGDNIDDKA
jgi:trigger factor